MGAGTIKLGARVIALNRAVIGAEIGAGGGAFAGPLGVIAGAAAGIVVSTGLVTVLRRSPVSLCHLGFEGERADAAQI